MCGLPVAGEAFLIAIAVGIYFISRYSRWKPGNLALALTHFTIIYLLWVVSAFIYDAYVDYKMSIFEVDEDRIYSSDEVLSEEHNKYYSISVNDAGRNLAPIFGFICAFLWSSVFFVTLRSIPSIHNVVAKIKRRKPGE